MGHIYTEMAAAPSRPVRHLEKLFQNKNETMEPDNNTVKIDAK